MNAPRHARQRPFYDLGDRLLQKHPANNSCSWHKHSTHAKPATPSKPTETRIFWCRNGRADGRGTATSSRGLRRRIIEDRPQCPVKMGITVHYSTHPDQSIGPPVLYELAKKSGGEHKESLRSIDSKRRNEKVIEACTQHLLENQGVPVHFVAKCWKEEDSFRQSLEDAGGHDVGPDDAQNYVRQNHLARKQKTKPKRDSVRRVASSTSLPVSNTKLLDPEVLSGLKAYHAALPALLGSKPAFGDIMARRQFLSLSIQHFNNNLTPMPPPPPDPATGMVPQLRERDLVVVSSHDGLYIALRFIQPPLHSSELQRLTSCMLYLYPSGLISPNMLAHLPSIRQMVQRTCVPALAVDYRVAPEYTPFNTHPITGVPMASAIQDAFDALLYLQQHAPDLSIDANRIIVVGEGGGGAVAAALCHYALKRGITIAKQVLCSPMLDDRPGGMDPPPPDTFTNGDAHSPPAKSSKLPNSHLLWTAADDATAWSALLTPPATIANGAPPVLGPEVVPGRMVEAPKGLAPVYIDVGEYEILRDECVEYARKCWVGTVSCELHVVPGAGSWYVEVAPGAQVSEQTKQRRVNAVCAV